mmetsp:Transcript_26391/g.76157  ORF Transcript_26391/g.76157 Transcript_26391/m.76157 type:complete len:190 (-) Transcript_26391:423-992(-)
MGAALSHFTTYLANSLCGGSSRKLIAGWWYSILALSLIISLTTFWTVSTRSSAESFSALWSTIIVVGLCIGGTMVMRRFHTSIAVGFFMGSVVATSQLFFLLFLIYLGYAKDRDDLGYASAGEKLSALLSLLQCLLLGSFAAILGAHRSQILDKNGNPTAGGAAAGGAASATTAGADDDTYEPPQGDFA